MFNTIFWAPDPIMFQAGSFRIAYYGLLFAAGMFIGYYFLQRIWKKEGVPEKTLDALTMYMIIGTVIGARLGHVFFYDWPSYKDNLISIFKIWEGGLASHGAAVGILTSAFFYMKKYKPKSFWWVMDRVCIAVAFAALFIRTGNFVNSEIIGKAANSPFEVMFYKNVEDRLLSARGTQNLIVEEREEKIEKEGITYPGIKLSLELLKSDFQSTEFVEGYYYSKRNELESIRLDSTHHSFRHIEFFDQKDFEIKDGGTFYVLEFKAYAVPRHPAQLYEAFSSGLLFLLLIGLYYKKNKGQSEGFLFGVFLVWQFTLRFFYEFLKENQVLKEETMTLNMGQWLSIPLVLLGLYLLLIHSRQKKNLSESVNG